MAKLSAHGFEVARLVTRSTAQPNAFEARLYGDKLPHGKRWEYTYSFRSDGAILRKVKGLDVHPNDPVGDPHRCHTWPWKLHAKLRDPKRDTLARQRALAARWANTARETGRFVNLREVTL